MAAIARIALFVAVCGLTTGCGRNPAATRTVPKDVRQFLGDRAVAILQQPQRVELYRVSGPMQDADGKPVPVTSPSPKHIGDMLILATAPERDANFGQEFAALFLSRDAYLFGAVKACIFQPDTVIRVHGPSGDWLQFVFCFSCSEFHVATFDEHGNPAHTGGGTEDFDGVADRLRPLIDRAFGPAIPPG